MNLGSAEGHKHSDQSRSYGSQLDMLSSLAFPLSSQDGYCILKRHVFIQEVHRQREKGSARTLCTSAYAPSDSLSCALSLLLSLALKEKCISQNLLAPLPLCLSYTHLNHWQKLQY